MVLKPYTLPPDTRAYGQGNPPADMNAVTDALLAAGALTNVMSTTYGGGADPTGTADSTAAIQAVLNGLSAGQVLYFPAGTYLISAPLVFPSGVPCSLRGPLGATQGGAGSPATGAAIQLTSAFAQGTAPANGALVLTSSRQDVADLWINGNNAGTAVDGINSSGNGASFRRVGINNMTGWGANCTGGYGLYADTMIIQGCTAGGFTSAATDNYLHNVHAQSNTASGAHGIVIHDANARLVACRSDLNGGSGFVITPYTALSNQGVPVVLAGCGTESNQQHGCLVSGGGNSSYGPVQLVGCQFTGDGQNGGSGGGGYAGVMCQGRVTVTLTDVDVCAAGGPSPAAQWPEYALATAANSGSGAVPDIVTADGGLWQAATAFVHDGAPAGVLNIGKRVYGFLGNQNGTSGTTSYVQVTSPHAITTPAIAFGTPVTNTQGRDITAVVSGGTITAIAVSGVTTGLTSGPVLVRAGESVTLTGSGATWKWY